MNIIHLFGFSNSNILGKVPSETYINYRSTCMLFFMHLGSPLACNGLLFSESPSLYSTGEPICGSALSLCCFKIRFVWLLSTSKLNENYSYLNPIIFNQALCLWEGHDFAGKSTLYSIF